MFSEDKKLYVAHSSNGPIYINGQMANRHGLIAGATGTGKTVTLQVLAETFSQAGVPCFMADMKGDLSGISQTGKMSSFIEKRCPEFGIENPHFEGCPTRFFDVFGEQGFPLRTTVSAMGPQLLTRILDLNDTQEGVLNILFKIADDAKLLLLDLKDLRMMLDFIAKNAASFTTQYGNISSASVGAIQRAILTLENQGGTQFFGEPAFNVEDLLDTEKGRGVMNVLVADKLMLQPKLYSTFLLWLITELYAKMPEVGDMDLPKMVFFFDEAHTLFEGTSKALTDKIEQVIRLIRSKGIGIYFITQAPTDLPDNVLGQLGNRVQHALRAYTPKDQKVVRTVADTFRANPEFKTADVITELATGEALVSFLDEKGAPSVVERAKILFPLSQIGAITDGQRLDVQNAAPAKIKEYTAVIDRESAYEILTAQYEEQARKEEKEAEKKAKEEAKAAKEKEKTAASKKKSSKGLNRTILGTLATAAATTFARSLANSAAKSITTGKKSSSKTASSSKKTTSTKKSGTALEKATKSAANTVTRTITNEVLKSILNGR